MSDPKEPPRRHLTLDRGGLESVPVKRLGVGAPTPEANRAPSPPTVPPKKASPKPRKRKPAPPTNGVLSAFGPPVVFRQRRIDPDALRERFLQNADVGADLIEQFMNAPIKPGADVAQWFRYIAKVQKTLRRFRKRILVETGQLIESAPPKRGHGR